MSISRLLSLSLSLTPVINGEPRRNRRSLRKERPERHHRKAMRRVQIHRRKAGGSTRHPDKNKMRRRLPFSVTGRLHELRNVTVNFAGSKSKSSSIISSSVCVGAYSKTRACSLLDIHTNGHADTFTVSQTDRHPSELMEEIEEGAINSCVRARLPVSIPFPP